LGVVNLQPPLVRQQLRTHTDTLQHRVKSYFIQLCIPEIPEIITTEAEKFLKTKDDNTPAPRHCSPLDPIAVGLSRTQMNELMLLETVTNASR
jgi:hypothetical protein